MKIHYSERFDGCPVAVVNAVMAEHLALRCTYPYAIEMLHGDEHTLWAGTPNAPVGAMLWVPTEYSACWWVLFACTFMRRKGVYWALRKELVRRARKDKLARTIESNVAVKNTRMVELMKRVGSVPVSYKFRYQVKGA